MRLFVWIMSFVWLAFGVVCLLAESDKGFVIGIINTAVFSMGGIIMDTINKKENN